MRRIEKSAPRYERAKKQTPVGESYTIEPTVQFAGQRPEPAWTTNVDFRYARFVAFDQMPTRKDPWRSHMPKNFRASASSVLEGRLYRGGNQVSFHFAFRRIQLFPPGIVRQVERHARRIPLAHQVFSRRDSRQRRQQFRYRRIMAHRHGAGDFVRERADDRIEINGRASAIQLRSLCIPIGSDTQHVGPYPGRLRRPRRRAGNDPLREDDLRQRREMFRDGPDTLLPAGTSRRAKSLPASKEDWAAP